MHVLTSAKGAGRSTFSGAVIAATLLATTILSLSVNAPAASAQQSRYYPATGYSINGAFLSFFDRYGGLRMFGYPISNVVNEGGRPVQYFERQRFEYHNDLAGTPNEVQLSRLGAELAPQSALQTSSAPFASTAKSIYLRETGHSLSYSFLEYWNANGGVRVLGFPVSEPVMENGFLVQYFERARMEYHPEKASSGFGIELGLLGKQYLAAHPDIAARLQPASRGAEPPPARSAQPPPSALSARESYMLEAINKARLAAGVGPVSLNGALRNLAQSRSQDMAARGYFAHETPDGQNFISMLQAAKIPFKFAGEILANNNYNDAETSPEAFRGFMNSAPHTSILLDARYNMAGVGEVTDARGFHFYTVIFIQQ